MIRVVCQSRMSSFSRFFSTSFCTIVKAISSDDLGTFRRLDTILGQFLRVVWLMLIAALDPPCHVDKPAFISIGNARLVTLAALRGARIGLPHG